MMPVPSHPEAGRRLRREAGPAPSPPAVDADIEREVLRSLVAAHVATAVSSIAASTALGLTVAVFLVGRVDGLALAAWSLALGLGIAARAFWHREAKRALRSPAGDPAHALARIRLGAGLHGACWGMLALLARPADGSLEMPLAVLVGALVVGAMAVTLFDQRAGLAFALPAALPTALLLSLPAGEPAFEVQVVALLVFAVMLLFASTSRRDRRERRALAAAHRAELDSLAAARSAEARLREAGEQLAEKSRVLETTFDSLRQGVLCIAPDGRVRAWNRRVLELLDLPESLMTAGATLQDITRWQSERGHFGPMLEAVSENGRAGVQRVLEGDYASLVERYRRVTPGGRVLDVEAHFAADGSLVRTFTDVSERVGAEHALRESETRFRTLADGAPALIWLTDAHGRQTWFNQRWLLWRGSTLEAELAASWSERVHPEDYPGLHEVFKTAFDARRRYDTEFRLKRADGGWGWIADAGVPRFDPSGRFEGYVSYSWDVSERRAAAAALLAAKEEAERANRAKSDFLSRMSHELRTPMNAILGFGQLLENDAGQPLAPEQRERVQMMMRGGRHLLALIDEVLDLARIESGTLALQVEPVRLGPLLADALRLVQPVAAARGIALCPDAASFEGVVVMADRMRLEQVVLNLASNAIKYNREGGRVEFRLSAAAEGAAWRLEVRDEGPGIPAAQRGRLFQAFERLDAGDTAVEGAGIGLALSKWLVELMGGAIGVDSEPGRGSSFWVCLRRAPDAPPEPPPAPEPGLTQPMPLADRRVLYVEDNAVNQLLMEGMLAQRPGLALEMVDDPLRGIERAVADPPDLVLLDIQLPRIDGFEVLRRLRAHPATRRVPVVAVSANAMPDDVEAARRAGFDDYLTKPLMLQRLLDTVDRALGVTAG